MENQSSSRLTLVQTLLQFQKKYSRTGWSHFKKTSTSLHGPAKQAPANKMWTIHWHADISTIKHMLRDFCSS